MFSIEAKNGKFLVNVSGFIRQEEAEGFITEYQEKLKTVDPLKTTLILDGRDLKVSAQEMLPILEGCLQMYINDKFQKIYMLNFNSTLAMSQVKRLLDKNGFTDRIGLIDSAEEAV